MSIPAPLTLAAATLEIDGTPAIRVTECALVIHEESVELVPSKSSTDRLQLPTRRWMEATLTIAAATPLQGLPLIGTEFPCELQAGGYRIDATVAQLTGSRLILDQDGAREILTLRFSRWTIEEV